MMMVEYDRVQKLRRVPPRRAPQAAQNVQDVANRLGRGQRVGGTLDFDDEAEAALVEGLAAAADRAEGDGLEGEIDDAAALEGLLDEVTIDADDDESLGAGDELAIERPLPGEAPAASSRRG